MSIYVKLASVFGRHRVRSVRCYLGPKSRLRLPVMKKTEIRAALDTEGVRFLTPMEGECFAFHAKVTASQIVIH